ncbi:Exonuclease V [Psilocybe cubensis]|uniref:Exonuclease V n=1 Tax=Psilocybe cubensis TaxID=181762 RepID=A0ACB8HF46_PSICU|nr:Exonuclease V [Psilocybe cubensis]KAH9486314.1 Exonuclease V [Psilocybe cubensis]
MSGYSSDDFHDLDLSEFTAEDFAYIDANIASLSGSGRHGTTEAEPKLSEERYRLNSADSKAFDTDDEDIYCANETSFRSDTFDLNLSTLTNEELDALDEYVSKKIPKPSAGPSIAIEIEGPVDVSGTSKHTVGENKHINGTWKPRLSNSPLNQFRPYMTLSVTDLTSPAWCEVQYDYGLRGRRSRPISERPQTFQSSSGKTIRPEPNIVKKNDIQTRQGLAVHKELEREIKFEELQVDITSEETRWALRYVAANSLILLHLQREMPVFGVIHDEVVVGIMDEVIKEEVPKMPNSIAFKSSKRPSDHLQPSSISKKPRTSLPYPQTRIDSCFESSKKEKKPSQSPSLVVEEEQTQTRSSSEYVLHIKDNKTREKPYIPSEADMQSGRMQLMLYRRLLSQLISTNPPYDFSPFWSKLGVNSAAIFPTKFLVQAHLIEESSGFQSTCLDDLVSLWHSEIKDLNIVGVDPTLELVYRLRPSPRRKKKKHGLTTPRPPQTISDEERDLMIAIAASLEDVSASQTQVDMSHIGPSTHFYKKNQFDSPNSGTEDTKFQTTLAESIIAQNVSKTFDNSGIDFADLIISNAYLQLPLVDLPEIECVDVTEKIGKGKEKEIEAEEQGIRRFKIIGTKRFLHNDEELDKYLDHVLEWWRGERRPEGVPLDRTYRCSYCEYENDCEWRAEKAAEIRQKKLPDP